jgi:hypothetical protein
MKPKIEKIRGKSKKDVERMPLEQSERFFQPKKPYNFGEVTLLRKWCIEWGIIK